MVKSIYIGSVEPRVGKSALSIGVGMELRERGYRVGYMKPISQDPQEADGIVDKDVEIIRDLLEIGDSIKDMSPIVFTESLILEAMMGELDLGLMAKSVNDLYQRLSVDRDVMIVEGSHTLSSGSIIGLPAQRVMQMTLAEAILVVKCQDSASIEKILLAKNTLNERIKGVFINDVPTIVQEKAKDVIAPFLEHQGIKVFGIIPYESLLRSVSIRRIKDELGAEVLIGHQYLDDLVERYLIGAMTPESALSYFRRITGKAVITGGDRADIQLAALETETKCLILTGNMRPSQAVLSVAQERGIPVLLAEQNTLDVVSAVDSLLQAYTIEKRKVPAIRRLIRDHVDIEEIIQAYDL